MYYTTLEQWLCADVRGVCVCVCVCVYACVVFTWVQPTNRYAQVDAILGETDTSAFMKKKCGNNVLLLNIESKAAIDRCVACARSLSLSLYLCGDPLHPPWYTSGVIARKRKRKRNGLHHPRPF